MKKITSVAYSINRDIRNKNFGSAYAAIKKTIELWKVKDNYDLLSDEARILAELYIKKQ
ncbi:MAG: hypothetical protein SCALA701_26670 [Candidatus Scalindua sp.]|nr:hypothetical protein [Planctomycetota bacterium]GJQ59866.1 MAG: hypothetical protein SCALA701_26670 [Candidatus Scalindua sp.]